MPPLTGDENWKAVVGYEGLYEVSDRGRVRSLMGRGGPRPEPLLLRPQPGNKKGYLRVNLGRPGDPKHPRYVAHLVLLAFKGSRPGRQDARHLNDDHLDNSLSNLEWGTRRTNMQDAVRNGRVAHGAQHHAAKIDSPDTVFALRKQGLTQRQIGERVGLSQTQVWKILNGLRWARAGKKAI